MTQHDTRAGAQARSATRVSQRRIGSTPPRIERIPRPVSGLQRSSTGSGSPGTQKQKGARYADASEKTNLAGIYASLAPYCS